MPKEEVLSREKAVVSDIDKDDADYFHAYGHIGIHEEMIRDETRTLAYRDAMLRNPSDFKDKIVLDVGCGSGILSIFAARAGAKKDASDVINVAIELAQHNQLADRIEFFHGKMEEIELPESVDVIISEWMGYFLLYESMLSSVLHARDKWLKSGGKIYPAEANIYISLMYLPEYHEDHLDFWKEACKLYDIDFTPVLPWAKRSAFGEAQVNPLPSDQELSFPTKLLTIDLYHSTWDSLMNIVYPFRCAAIGNELFYDSLIVIEVMHGFLGYFDVTFRGTDNVTTLSTSPAREPTHWQQTMFFIDEPVALKQDDAVVGKVVLRPCDAHPRSLVVNMNWTLGGESSQHTWDLK